MEQAQATYCLNHITIESVRQDFEDWRNNETTHKIPGYLWDKVFQLAQSVDSSYKDDCIPYIEAHFKN